MDTVKDGKKKLLKVSKMLTEHNVSEIKYLLKDELGEGESEQIKKPLKLLEKLQQMGLVSPDDFTNLIDLLNYIERNDIVEFLTGEKSESRLNLENQTRNSHSSSYSPITNSKISKKETERIKFFDDLAQYLGVEWKRLGRLLEVEEHILTNIDKDKHSTHEKAFSMLKQANDKRFSSLDWKTIRSNLKILNSFQIIRDIEAKYPQLNILEESQTVQTAVQETLSPEDVGPPVFVLNNCNKRLVNEMTEETKKLSLEGSQ